MTTATPRRLTDQEIGELLVEYNKTHTQSIRDRVILQFTNLVESIARRFAGAAEPAEDLAQEGYIGLITAVEGYDPTKGVKFSTYATHFVIGRIKHYLRDRGKIIKEPAWLQELNQRVARVMEALAQELGRTPTHAEIGAQLAMSEEAIAELLTTREVFRVSSLSMADHEDDSADGYSLDRISQDSQVEFEVPIADRYVLEAALHRLKELEQSVVREFFFAERNQTEIARQFGISCNYVSHILRNSTRKLRKMLVSDELKESQMELARLRRRAEDQARVIEEYTVVDPVTRLYNRRYFDNRLDEEFSRARREQHPVAVILVNLSGAEEPRRRPGSVDPEDAVRQVGEMVRASVRKADVVTRFDQRTVGVILPHTGTQSEVVEQRLTGVLVSWLFQYQAGRPGPHLELQIGRAVSEDNSVGPDEIVRSAQGSLCPAAAEVEMGMAA